MTRYAKIKMISFLALGLVLLTSCQVNIPTEESQTMTSIETTPDVETLPEGVVETPLGWAYQSDVEKYGEICAPTFYEWRQKGNPDWQGAEYVGYHSNEGGIILEPLQKTYSAKDRDEKWGVDVISISDDIQFLDYSDALNIDKKTDGQWVRQALLDPERIVTLGTRPAIARKDKVLNTVFTISLDEAAFEIEPGEYRFIFYALVTANGKTENRMYYIPFEVVE